MRSDSAKSLPLLLLLTCALCVPGHGGTMDPNRFNASSKNRWTIDDSPVYLRRNLVIDKPGELTVDPGVVVKADPGVGIFVKGALIAKGTVNRKILFTTSASKPNILQKALVRLVDGPNALAGRLQIFHKDEWRSVCTNSRNWTASDYLVACRQLGFEGGGFFQWSDPVRESRRMLVERPACMGPEKSLVECDTSGWKLGSRACTEHPDIALTCNPKYSHSLFPTFTHWRGIHFDHAVWDLGTTPGTKRRVSRSALQFVELTHAGMGANREAVSSLTVFGVPPEMVGVSVENSAYDGIGIHQCKSDFTVANTTLTNNRGNGIFVNTSATAELQWCTVSHNAANGVHYVFQDSAFDRVVEGKPLHDLCLDSLSLEQNYPLYLLAEQLPTRFKDGSGPAEHEKISVQSCAQPFRTRKGHVLTVQVAYMYAEENDTASLTVRDGSDEIGRVLLDHRVNNVSYPQSVSSSHNVIYISFKSLRGKRAIVHIKVSSDRAKKADLVLEHCRILSNEGAGVLVKDSRGAVAVRKSYVANNSHVGGVFVAGGAGEVNVTHSTLEYNKGSGVFVHYAGGAVNVVRSTVQRNTEHGVAVFANRTSAVVPVRHVVVVAYSRIEQNGHHGAVVGNFCNPLPVKLVNVSSNIFENNRRSALKLTSCLKGNEAVTSFVVGNNEFRGNALAVDLSPAVNVDGRVAYNQFRGQKTGTILIQNNNDDIVLDTLPAQIEISDNRFTGNRGLFVAILELSQYGSLQHLLFTRNFVEDNEVKEPFAGLNLRKRVGAVLAIGSSNVQVYRNILSNNRSAYEIASRVTDQSVSINASYNWLGSKDASYIFSRIFDRKDRYNLAKVIYNPYLLLYNDPETDFISRGDEYIPTFYVPGNSEIGGELTGQEIISYTDEPLVLKVKRDIYVRPGGILKIPFGTTLKFDRAVGMMVAGQLHAEGTNYSSAHQVTFSLLEDFGYNRSSLNVRLVGGQNRNEGVLQVKIGPKWGSVCNYGWTVQDSAVVCHQLGLVLNAEQHLLNKSIISGEYEDVNIVLSNVKCTEFDTDVTQCYAEQADDIDNSCNHDEDVVLRCYDLAWSGIRFGMTAERSILKHAVIERAGLFDAGSNLLSPAIQIDFNHHVVQDVVVKDNLLDGLEIVYSDFYNREKGTKHIVRSRFLRNQRHGICLRTLDLKLLDSEIVDNRESGIHFEPTLSNFERRQLLSWSKTTKQLVVSLPQVSASPEEVFIRKYRSAYLFMQSSAASADSFENTTRFRTDEDFVIGIQLLSYFPIEANLSIVIFDSAHPSSTSRHWDVRRDALNFPCVSASSIISVRYSRFSGSPVFEVALMLTSVQRAAKPSFYHSCEPEPILEIFHSELKRNRRGISMITYEGYTNARGDQYFRHSNQSIVIHGRNELAFNSEEAVFLESKPGDGKPTNVSEMKIVFNDSNVHMNGRILRHLHGTFRDANTIFHWRIQNNSIRRNEKGGLAIQLPYVVQYNANISHSIFIENNLFVDNRQFEFSLGGHFSRVLVNNNVFSSNECSDGLFSVKGTEKYMLVSRNSWKGNVCRFVVEYDIRSQSEIMGFVPSEFFRNVVQDNTEPRGYRRCATPDCVPSSYAVAVKGIQRVHVQGNLFGGNGMECEFVCGVPAGRLGGVLHMQQNWWGTANHMEIKRRIFDFDRWNSYAIANFTPFYMDNFFDAPISSPFLPPPRVDVNDLGGRLHESLTLAKRGKPYIVKSDLTIMPDAVLTIEPGVHLQFPPGIGILVLGILHARGTEKEVIRMEPLKAHLAKSLTLRGSGQVPNIRLCPDVPCSAVSDRGFLEVYNRTTLQWVPVCDRKFTRKNARVVCGELGFPGANVFYSHDGRQDYQYDFLDRVLSWPKSYLCHGDETRFEECPVRLDRDADGDRVECRRGSLEFVFVHCGEPNLPEDLQPWGGIRFTPYRFEESSAYEFGALAPEEQRSRQSVLEYVDIYGAGMLHGEPFPAVQCVLTNPRIQNSIVRNSSGHGISMVSSQESLILLHNSITDNLGFGVHILVLVGKSSEESNRWLSLLGHVHLPHSLFGFVDVCDPEKVVLVEERVFLYYQYRDHPVQCVKIFRNDYDIQSFGFRLLQANLWDRPEAASDVLEIYDGSVYNATAKRIDVVHLGQKHATRFLKTESAILSVHFRGSGGSHQYGFLAEVTTLPLASFGPDREATHNISHSLLRGNYLGGIWYGNSGTFYPSITMEWNQIRGNGRRIHGNFTSSEASVQVTLQNTPKFYFRNNLVAYNEGGLSLFADSSSEAASLNGIIRNCLFAGNRDFEALKIVGRRNAPFQKVQVFHNFVTRNFSPYRSTILLDQVVANFSFNYLSENTAEHVLVVNGFDAAKLPIFQHVSHNGFYLNAAVSRGVRSTVVANSSGQRYSDNYFVNPDNSIELATLNTSRIDSWKIPVEARWNWWGYNTTAAVMGRIRDNLDDEGYLAVNFEPFHTSNRSLLDGKCPPNWRLISGTCYIYVGGPLRFSEAKEFCRSQNASMPYIQNNHYYDITNYLRYIQENYADEQMTWVQHYDSIGKCTVMVHGAVSIVRCDYELPFICESDPKIHLDPLYWISDNVILTAMVVSVVAVLMIVVVIIVWLLKSKYRRQEKFVRKNSIRESIRSSRSTILSGSNYNIHYARRFMSPSQYLYPHNLKHSFRNQNDSADLSTERNLTSDDMAYEHLDSHNTNISTTMSSLDDRFAYDPKLENATVNAMVHPPFNITFQNRGYKEDSTITTNYSTYKSAMEDSNSMSCMADGAAYNNGNPFRSSYVPNSVSSTEPTRQLTSAKKPTQPLICDSSFNSSSSKLLETAM